MERNRIVIPAAERLAKREMALREAEDLIQHLRFVYAARMVGTPDAEVLDEIGELLGVPNG